MNTISTHVLDTASGSPAGGMKLALELKDGGTWAHVNGGTTNDDGRVPDLKPEGGLKEGVYRMRFETGAWFEANGIEGFYPVVEVVFQLRTADEHYHVPLLISPFGYSTYRGS